ncbi:hypothetical protein [Sporosarcina koreensis]|uniref:Uncharacterized protein n=1 Tax=Sporosarcina koreensis TaxID=334735 RepID=A0ABW0TVV5_9BACL
MLGNKGLKTFIVFEKLDTQIGQLELFRKDKTVQINKIQDLNLDYIDEYEILKEYEREILSETLTEYGDTEYEYKIVNKVARVAVWEFNNTPYIIVFSRGISNLMVKNLIEESFGYKLKRLDFNKVFFNEIIELNDSKVVQTTFKSLNIDQEFSIEGLINESSNFTSENVITELEVILHSLNIKFRVSRLGRVALYGEPDIKTIAIFVERLVNILTYIRKGD